MPQESQNAGYHQNYGRGVRLFVSHTWKFLRPRRARLADGNHVRSFETTVILLATESTSVIYSHRPGTHDGLDCGETDILQEGQNIGYHQNYGNQSLEIEKETRQGRQKEEHRQKEVASGGQPAPCRFGEERARPRARSGRWKFPSVYFAVALAAGLNEIAVASVKVITMVSPTCT